MSYNVSITPIRRYKFDTGEMRLKDSDGNKTILRVAELNKIYFQRRRLNNCYFIKLHSIYKNNFGVDVYMMKLYTFICGNDKKDKEKVDTLLNMFYGGVLIEDLITFYKL